MFELFSFYLQGGLIDVQVPRGGADRPVREHQHDRDRAVRRGHARLPGSGGACEIAINARQVFVIMRQSKRSFVETIDFRTSAGNLGGAEQSERIRREQGWLGRGPSVVVTDLGIWHFGDDGEMRLEPHIPARRSTRCGRPWAGTLLAPAVAETPRPADELRLIRAELDPTGAYTS